MRNGIVSVNLFKLPDKIGRVGNGSVPIAVFLLACNRGLVGELGDDCRAVNVLVAVEVRFVRQPSEFAHRLFRHRIDIRSAVEPRIALLRAAYVNLDIFLRLAERRCFGRNRHTHGTGEKRFHYIVDIRLQNRAAAVSARPLVFVVEPDIHSELAAFVHACVDRLEPVLAKIFGQQTRAAVDHRAAPPRLFHKAQLPSNFRRLHFLVPTPERHDSIRCGRILEVVRRELRIFVVLQSNRALLFGYGLRVFDPARTCAQCERGECEDITG